jgi:FdrA protein
MALDALDADAPTKHIVIVSKPPPAAMITKVLERVSESDKPATICFIGAKALTMPDNATQVFSLKAAAQSAMRLSIDDAATENTATEEINLINGKSRVMGLFSGGTLCAEAQVIFHNSNEAVTSNAPIPGVPLLTDVNDCHLLLDLGSDEYTRGKPHPMIDPTVRDETLIKAMGSDNVGLILIDVVLGFGAHDDPAGHLADVIINHRCDNGPAIVASVTGTEADPQVPSTQISKLTAIGVHVAPTNADAASWALGAIRSSTQGL